jgi:hypothetical protein
MIELLLCRHEAESKLQSLREQKKKIAQLPVTHTCNPSYSTGRDQEDIGSRPAQGNSETLSQKYPTHTQKWGWQSGVAQVAQGLPSKCEALYSNPTTAKINK